MAIYRPAGRRSAVIGVAAGVAVGLLVGVALGRLSAPGAYDTIASLREDVSSIAVSLEVVRVEYPKLLAADPDPGGAEGAVNRATTEFDAIAAQLAMIDPASTDAARTALGELSQLIASRQPAESVGQAIDAVTGHLSSILPVAYPS